MLSRSIGTFSDWAMRRAAVDNSDCGTDFCPAFGVKTVILPALNEPDLLDIPEELRRDMTFVLARTHPRERRLSSPHGRIETAVAELPPLVHVDAYRVSSAMELDDLDIDFAGSIVVVEWGAGLTDGITDDWLQIDIVRRRGGAAASPTVDDVDDPSDADAVEPREVSLTAHGDRWRGWVDAVGN